MAPGDEALVVLALAGDARAYEALVRRYQSPVRGWLRGLTNDVELADDIAQETFIRAWSKLHTFSGTGSFKAWLMKLAHNQFLQAIRKSKSVNRTIERYGEELDTSSPIAASGFYDETPDIDRLLSVLAPDERKIMMLVYAFGFSHREANEVTEIPVGTIKSHLRRGKEKIRRRFGLGNDNV